MSTRRLIFFPCKRGFAEIGAISALWSALSLVPALPVAAQTPDPSLVGGVTILGGGAISGEVVNPDATGEDAVEILPELGGKVVVDASEIKRIVSLRPEQIEYRSFAPLQKDDVASHLKIAKWADGKNLRAEADARYRRVVELDPDNETARRALQHVKVDGVWVSKKERMEQNGWERVDGRLVSKQEAELIRKTRETADARRVWKKDVANLYRAALDGDRRSRDAIRRIRDPNALGPLVETYRDEGDPEGRALLTAAIANVGTPAAVGELGKIALNDDDPDVRAAAVDGIMRKKTALSDAVEYFRRVLRTTDDVPTLDRAAFALGKFESERAIPDLINALITDHKRKITIGSQETNVGFSNGNLTNFSPGNSVQTKTITETYRSDVVRSALVEIVAANYQTPVDFGFEIGDWIAWWRTEVEQTDRFYPRRDR